MEHEQREDKQRSEHCDFILSLHLKLSLITTHDSQPFLSLGAPDRVIWFQRLRGTLAARDLWMSPIQPLIICSQNLLGFPHDLSCSQSDEL